MYKNHKKSILFLMCLSVLLIFSVIKIYAEQWEQVPLVTQEMIDAGYSPGGEGGQWPYSICIDSVDGNFLLYGTDVGGIHRSLNGGELWEPCNIGYYSLGNCSFAIDPNNINRVLAISRGSTSMAQGIYFSTNKAATWTHVLINESEDTREIKEEVIYDKTSYDAGLGYSKIAYWVSRGATGRIHKSIDGGVSWSDIPGTESYGDSIIKVHPTQGYIYLANANGFFKSTDGGTNFVQKLTGVLTGLDVVNTEPDNVYICSSSEIYISTDSGENFTLIPSTGFPFYNLRTIKVSPVNIKNIMIENNEGDYYWNKYYSSDGGTNWTKAINDTTYNFLPHNNRRPMFAWHPTNENVVWSFEGDYISKSENGGALWEWANNGNNAIIVGGMFNFNTQNPDLMFVGIQDYNGAVTTNAGRTWKYINVSGWIWGGFVYGAYAATPDILFAGDADCWECPRTLRITRDGGETIIDTGIVLSGGVVDWYDPEVSYGDPTDPNVLFCCDYRSDDQGLTWFQMNGCDRVFTSNPIGARELYGRNGTDIVMSTNKGETWTAIHSEWDKIHDLAYDHIRNRLYIVTSSLSQYDIDTGIRTDITSRIPLDQYGTFFIQTVAVDPVNSDVVYVGSHHWSYGVDNGVTRSTDAGLTWEVISRSKRHNNPQYGIGGDKGVICIRVHPITREAYITTWLQGIWKIGPPDGADTTPPYTAGHNPVDGAVEVNIDTDIEVHIRDTQSGVDISSIVMTVEGVVVIPNITGSSSEYVVIYTPSSNFGYEQVVNVTIDAKDIQSNVMTQDSYSFTTESTSTPPTPEIAQAYKTSSQITIDGDISEWQGIDNGIKIRAEDVTDGTIDDDNDCSGMFYALWDTNYLYIACEITDNSLIADSEIIYHDDSVEIYVDGGHEAIHGYDSNDHQYTIDINNRITDRGITNALTTENVLHAVQTTANGYIVEVAIPYSYLEINPTNNQIIGYDLAINDDDNGGDRDGQSFWSNSGSEPWLYADSFSDLVLSSNAFSVDTTPPYTAGHNPVGGATNVNIDTDIEVHIRDTHSGVDISSIVMTVEGVVVIPDITGTSNEYVVIYTPSSNFGYEQVVNVTIDAKDIQTNVMTQDSYSFTTVSESLPISIYYVAKDGSDSNDGSEAFPWLTINYATGNLQAGDTCYVKVGTYNEQVEFQSSGSAGNYITLQAYQDDEVIIDGTGIDVPNYHGLIDSWLHSYIRIKGLHIQNGYGVGIEFDGSYPGNIQSHIEILDCEVSYRQTQGEGQIGVGIRLNSITDFKIDNCHVHHCDTEFQEAIRIAGHSSNFEVTDCHIHHNSNIGIDIVSRTTWGTPTHGLIKGNICHDNGTVADWASGIYSDGACYITIENNICYGNDIGISIGCEEDGFISHHNIARNNICYDSRNCNIIIGGSNTPEGGIVKDSIVRNNVLYHAELDYGDMIVGKTENNLIEHNIIIPDGGWWKSLSIGEYATNNTIDYNCFVEDAIWGNYPGDHNVYADPEFVDPANNDFHLSETSPCIDAGDPDFIADSNETDIDGQNRIMDGNNDGTAFVDIGADEYYEEGTDTTPPYTIGHNPVKGATNVNIDTDIEVHIRDTQSGVDISSIVMTVEGVTVTPDITGSSSEYVVIYTPSSNFGYEQVVNVTIEASDLGSNVMTPDSYLFTIESETLPPPEGAHAYKTLSPIIIDGDITEWQGIDNGIKIGAEDVTDGNIDDDNDCSGMFYALWDANYLYIACEITDDSLVADSEEIWNDDSVEIYVDGGHEATNGYDSNDHQYTIDKNNRITDRGITNALTTENVLHAVQTTSNGYIIEVAIPYSYLEINPTNNQIIGYDLAINDDDNSGDRDGQSFWSNSGSEPWLYADSFSDLVLSANVFSHDLIVPDKPKIIHIKAVSENKIELAWNSVPLATSYTLFRSLNNSVNDAKKIAGFSTGKTNYTDTSLTKNTTYYYWLKAYNTDGESEYSAAAFAATMQSADDNLDNLIVGPNPFKPNSSEGHDYIIFANLTEKATIKVYTVLGKLIVILKEKDGDGMYKWDVKRNNGKDLASGVYICHITNPQGESKFIKLMVIR